VPSIGYDYRYSVTGRDPYRLAIRIKCDPDMAPCDVAIDVTTSSDNVRLVCQLPSCTEVSTNVVGPLRDISVDPEIRILARRVPRLGDVLTALRSLCSLLERTPGADGGTLKLIFTEIGKYLRALRQCCAGASERADGTYEGRTESMRVSLIRDWQKAVAPENTAELAMLLNQLYGELCRVELEIKNSKPGACGNTCRQVAERLRSLLESIQQGRRLSVQWQSEY
jgi:hypothetical protein